MCSITLTPAYGRDYKSKAEILADWNADKDFVVNDIGPGGAYVSKAQLPELKQDGFTSIHFRYKQLRSVFVLELK